nr:DnaD domain-containing protein [Jeotgalibacillus aurantiacus]
MSHQIPWQEWIKAGYTSIPVMLLEHYRKLHLSETECMLIIQIHSFVERGESFPTPDQLSERMALTESECLKIIQKLIKKNHLKIEKQDIDGIQTESYSLEPLWECIMLKLAEDNYRIKVAETMENQTDLYSLFEQEFGRPLSPLECETLAMWIDQDEHSTLVIKAALREAVISNKLNFRYIDRILFEWKKKGIKSVEEIRKHSENFRKPAKKPEESSEGPAPFYNWLEN